MADPQRQGQWLPWMQETGPTMAEQSIALGSLFFNQLISLAEVDVADRDVKVRKQQVDLLIRTYMDVQEFKKLEMSLSAWANRIKAIEGEMSPQELEIMKAETMSATHLPQQWEGLFDTMADYVYENHTTAGGNEFRQNYRQIYRHLMDNPDDEDYIFSNPYDTEEMIARLQSVANDLGIELSYPAARMIYKDFLNSDQPENIIPGPTPKTDTESGGLPDSFVKLIMDFEGFRPAAYEDYGQLSIGYGTRTNDPNETIDEEEAERRLRKILQEKKQAVDDYAQTHDYDWTERQKLALTSFIFNLGIGALDQVTQSGIRTNDEIGRKMLEYNKAEGQPLSGLTKRREAESSLFIGS